MRRGTRFKGRSEKERPCGRCHAAQPEPSFEMYSMVTGWLGLRAVEEFCRINRGDGVVSSLIPIRAHSTVN